MPAPSPLPHGKMHAFLRSVTPAQVAVPILVGLVVLVLLRLSERVPELPEWTVARSKAQLADPVDRKAAQVLDAYQARSFDQNREFCGFLYREAGELRASQPVRGSSDSCTIAFDDAPADSNDIVATFHSHAAYDADYDNEAPSLADFRTAMADELDDYVATPGGRLWRISAQHEAALLVCGPGCLRVDRDQRRCSADEGRTSFRLKELEARSVAGVRGC